MFKAKINVVGPCQAGKSVLTNFIGDQTDNLQTEYHPTVGVRILEFESTVDGSTIDIELWDCSGKEEYEGCWPAMCYQSDGVIIVFDPDAQNAKPSLDKFYKHFVTRAGLKEKNCIVFANCKQAEQKNIMPPLSSVTMVVVNMEKNPEEIKESFQLFLRNVLEKLSESREKEEMSIIG